MGSFDILMETFLKEIDLMIKHMEKEFIATKMEQCILEIEKMICKMVLGLNREQMEADMKGFIEGERKAGLGLIFEVMEVNIQANDLIII
eukprot:CAMPEP_0202950808 /NCGR_PEP_ID=MMETSP1395-20130829/25800_1 /ASSEMBLY_ACC=CAM_ASM_000871 /TAXON_ID=5961 /ORGANISM="Blepharisma japonicum, Strain Stock R1072" /LENGTH=89 /DNA_ID=CAMNT_0049656211 /DNA_START=325 /DNA_END=594 /DNA_ORIENTATION=+